MPKYIKLIVAAVYFNLCFVSLSFSQESMTITTYYPSPYGSYNELTTAGNTYLATDSGRVGIGTLEPVARLQVEDGSIFVGTGTTIPGDTGSDLVLGNWGGTSWRGGTFAIDDLTYLSGGPYRAYFLNGLLTDADILVQTGNVGIGTMDPGANLDVNGEIRSRTGILQSLNPNNNDAGVSLSWLNDVARIRVGGNGAGASNGLDIQRVGNVSLMRILNNGNVGIGTAIPASRLDLGGGCMTGSICSDVRMKRNIMPMPEDVSYLDKVMKLQGVSFEWKNLTDRKHYFGLIAQDVEKVLPEVVMTDGSGDSQKGLSCTGVEAVLVEAIKEMRVENEKLKSRIEVLEKKKEVTP